MYSRISHFKFAGIITFKTASSAIGTLLKKSSNIKLDFDEIEKRAD